jgi:hypothetical protein
MLILARMRQDLWVNDLPGGESRRGQEHVAKAESGRRRLGRGTARPARYGESHTAQTPVSSDGSGQPLPTTPLGRVTTIGRPSRRRLNLRRGAR